MYRPNSRRGGLSRMSNLPNRYFASNVRACTNMVLPEPSSPITRHTPIRSGINVSHLIAASTSSSGKSALISGVLPPAYVSNWSNNTLSGILSISEGFLIVVQSIILETTCSCLVYFLLVELLSGHRPETPGYPLGRHPDCASSGIY